MSKRVNNIFLNSLKYDLLYEAYIDARKNKKYRTDVIIFNLKFEYNLKNMLNKLYLEQYNFSKYNLFYVYEPKERKILAASFRDRVLHTWYVKSFLEPIFIPSFIHTSYACIKGRGMHKCCDDVKKAIIKCYNKYVDEDANCIGYIIKMDVAKFFQNIDRDMLYKIICKKVKDKRFLKLTKDILDSSSMYDEVSGVGLPIGNYTSQIFANIYLNEVDRYAKETLRCKDYFRYMDDTIIICESKEAAQNILNKLVVFYEDKLRLRLNNKTDIFKITQGVNFCGYKIFVDRTKIRIKGKKKLVKKLKYIQYSIQYNKMNIEEGKRLLAGHIRLYKTRRYRRNNKEIFLY